MYLGPGTYIFVERVHIVLFDVTRLSHRKNGYKSVDSQECILNRRTRVITSHS